MPSPVWNALHLSTHSPFAILPDPCPVPPPSSRKVPGPTWLGRHFRHPPERRHLSCLMTVVTECLNGLRPMKLSTIPSPAKQPQGQRGGRQHRKLRGGAGAQVPPSPVYKRTLSSLKDEYGSEAGLLWTLHRKKEQQQFPSNSSSPSGSTDLPQRPTMPPCLDSHHRTTSPPSYRRPAGDDPALGQAALPP